MPASLVPLLQDTISLVFTRPFLFVCLSIAGFVIKDTAKRFRLPEKPQWPENENQSLAAELAKSTEDAATFLGSKGSEIGCNNCKVLQSLQYRDFGFIALYVAFFIADAKAIGGFMGALITALAILTGILDFLEDVAILKITRRQPAQPVRFGAPKWFFYFLTLGLQAFVFNPWPSHPFQTMLASITLAVLAVASPWGMVASLRRSFIGITSAAKVSALGLVGMAIYPLASSFSVPASIAAKYIVLERVPILFALIMVALAGICRAPGLLDLTPRRIFFVSLAAGSSGEAIASTARLIFRLSPDRIAGLDPIVMPMSGTWGDFLVRHNQVSITLAVSLPVLIAAAIFSTRQKQNPLKLTPSVAVGFAIVITGVHFARAHSSDIVSAFFHHGWLQTLREFIVHYPSIFNGYGDSLRSPGFNQKIFDDHLALALGFASTTLIYVVLGFYGDWQLRKPHDKEGDYTVPALCSAIMVLMWSCWILGALTFFFDAYRIPVLLILTLVGILTSQSSLSDHFYGLRPRTSGAAPSPAEVIGGSKYKQSESNRIIVAAANGGGIQAGAWVARVLAGLECENRGKFQDHFRMISSVSGGSVGSAIFLDHLERCSPQGAPKAAEASSLDEVSWGLAWPDFLTGLFPWLFGVLFTIGRGRALEAAWVKNSGKGSLLENELSTWNDRVRDGKLPAIIMNATVVETGQRLLFGTTRFTGRTISGRARLDAADLHGSNDVSIVTAARLSATFPYVTPASRADIPGPQPHLVDGGYYDNYGMATLVEWLDEALQNSRVNQVLVLQIHGVPVREDFHDQLYSGSRGWFYQALAPLATLIQVRSAGQVAHNDVELGLLQESYAQKGIAIHSLEFEFPNPNAPLSWHLTKAQQAQIEEAWTTNGSIKCGRDSVREFLNGASLLKGCTCPACVAATSAQVV